MKSRLVAVFLSLLFFIFLGHTLLGLMGTPYVDK